MPQIFISYRRADSANMSRRLYDALVARIGKKKVFRDVDTLMKGHDFRAGIEKYVIQSDVMLVLIGEQWLTIADEETGERRLDNPEDFVRIEVDMGLRHTQTVLPVLINGASMPTESELPLRLSSLAFKNAIHLRDSHFDEEFEQLLDALSIRPKPYPFAVIGSVIVTIAIIIAGIFGAMNLFGGTDTSGTPETQIALVQTEELISTTDAPLIPTDTSTSTVTDTPTSTATDSPSNTPESPTASDTPMVAEIPTYTPLELARIGVTANDDWTPYEQDFDGVAMVLVPAGCFMKGSTDEQIDYAVKLGAELGAERDWFTDEQPVEKVCFENPFWIDKTEVMQKDFSRLGGVNPSRFSGDNRPVEFIPRIDSQAFCELRGGSLPTEAQWEYAARGPVSLIFPWGNEFKSDYVVWRENSNGKTAEVGSHPTNVSWVGALDMIGNVGEWTNVYLVLRGGSWLDSNPIFLRSVSRSDVNPGSRFNFVGFRCVRSYEK